MDEEIILSCLNSMELGRDYNWRVVWYNATQSMDGNLMHRYREEMEDRKLIETLSINIDKNVTTVRLKTLGEQTKLKINHERLERLTSSQNMNTSPSENETKQNPKIWSTSNISFWFIIPFITGVLILIAWYLITKFFLN